MRSTEFIDQQIEELGLSEEFNLKSKRMGYRCLKDIVSKTPDEIIKKKGFDYDWLGELAGFLSERGQLHLLQPLTGKSPH